MKWLLAATANLIVLAHRACATNSQQSVHEFSAETWTVTNEYGNITVPGSYPSQVHLDLNRAGVITNPYYGLNEFNLRWIAAQNWTYTSKPIKNLRKDSTTSSHLVFDGLDTYTTITFCNQIVGTADNQFRQWYFDVTDVLEQCPDQEPVISLNFGSVPRIINALNASSSESRYIPILTKQLLTFFSSQHGQAYPYTLMSIRTDTLFAKSRTTLDGIGAQPLSQQAHGAMGASCNSKIVFKRTR